MFDKASMGDLVWTFPFLSYLLYVPGNFLSIIAALIFTENFDQSTTFQYLHCNMALFYANTELQYSKVLFIKVLKMFLS